VKYWKKYRKPDAMNLWDKAARRKKQSGNQVTMVMADGSAGGVPVQL